MCVCVRLWRERWADNNDNKCHYYQLRCFTLVQIFSSHLSILLYY